MVQILVKDGDNARGLVGVMMGKGLWLWRWGVGGCGR